jgi:hypothetical protein
MRQRLSRKGMLLLSGICICLLLAGFIFFQGNDTKKDTEKKNAYVVEQVVVENQVLKVKLLDFISSKNAVEKPTAQNINIKAKEEIAGVSITSKQQFSKTIALLPPMADTKPFAYENKQPSHNAYILVLVGDVVKYIDSNGKEKNVIENARIEYYVQSVLLEENYNSLYILSMDGTSEKMVKVDDYKKEVSNVDTYKEMLQW